MFTLADWISDHAILHHLEGTSDRDRLTLNGKVIPVTDGKWRADFEDGDLCLQDEDMTLNLHDIRHGLVVLAAGQSNMEWPVSESRNEADIARRLEGRDISWLQVPRILYPGHQPGETMTWRRLDPEHIGDVSAVALLAALELETDQPIGLVGCYKGGSSAASWVSEEDLATDPGLHQFYVTDYWEDIQDQTPEEEDRKILAFDQLVRDYNERFAAMEQAHPELSRAALKEIVGHTPFPGPKGHKDFLRPAGLHETMMLRLRGLQPDILLWYQGEEDTKYSQGYHILLPLLIRRYREVLDKPDLPVVIAQLPGYQEHDVRKHWGPVRLAQQQTADQDPYCDIICLLDAGDHENIHPQDKTIPGQRLGRLAGSMLGLKPWTNGPRLVSRTKTTVTFDQPVDGGSDTVNWTGPYGLEDDPEPRFFSGTGIPAFPFE